MDNDLILSIKDKQFEVAIEETLVILSRIILSNDKERLNYLKETLGHAFVKNCISIFNERFNMIKGEK